MRRTVLALAAVASLTVAVAVAVAPTAGAAVAPDGRVAASGPELNHGKSVSPTKVQGQAGKPGGGSSITYHRGPVMLGTTKAYYIWYGNWAATGGQDILTDFAANVGGSPYYNINTTYTNGSGQQVQNAVSLGGQYTYTNNLGLSLSDAQIQTIVADSIGTNKLPSDVNGVYFVLTAKGVTASSGFLTKYCGWHTYASIGGTSIKYSFVGNAAGTNLGSCAAQTTVSPNGNPGVDAMVSVLAHELEEAVTDPELNAWYDTRGYENADKCAWTFGSTYSSGGGIANMKLGSRDYLIQQNWNAGTSQKCALSYP